MIHFKFLILFLLVSCNTNTTPEKLLRNFEQELALGKISKHSLSNWMTEEAINKYELSLFSINRNYFKKMTVNYSNCLKDVCSFTYDVSYKIVKDGIDSQMDVRKQAVLRMQDDKTWLIDEMDVIKSYIDNKIPIKI